MPDATIQVKPNGPLLVTGNFEVIDANGTKLPVTEKAWLCRCGASNTKPLCDGTHKTLTCPAPAAPPNP
ncbi:MAG: CDGSH iron-sulfur domain-containing protein [Tepidisphaeraceae bacterium]|jgi:CDGSH-type Zn-finger protein